LANIYVEAITKVIARYINVWSSIHTNQLSKRLEFS